ncbi:MAG: methionine adenosyltransferase [Candidatus Cloacimonetes bacterium HGW-Cloacimonetes-2]|nr:MAG: methionine adenosyltransferase [Candidatus Cloacimonetes bacterium HGW-Cloacimonetes-2]
MTALHADLHNRKNGFVFSSESVSEGHPDKVCDQISDAILDAHLTGDPNSRVACETLATENLIVLSGEITSNASPEIEPIVRKVIRDIGYTLPDGRFDHNCRIENYLHKQTTELQDNANCNNAGDQGLMFGYACNQTKHLMPLPIFTAHKLLQELSSMRKENRIAKLLPDAKSQVSFRYVDRVPVALETLVISTNHLKMSEKEFKDMQAQISEEVVIPVISKIEEESVHMYDIKNCKIMINPSNMWELGGPAADTGLTGRKIIVDTYGGWAQHGGGAFSGKDATKVDRSAAYMTRHMAKSVVGSGLADECLIQIAYIIGEKDPVSLMVDTFNTGKIPDGELEKVLMDSFDLTVKGIIEYLDLKKPVFLPTAAYGHFGREDAEFTWETVKNLKP